MNCKKFFTRDVCDYIETKDCLALSVHEYSAKDDVFILLGEGHVQIKKTKPTLFFLSNEKYEILDKWNIHIFLSS